MSHRPTRLAKGPNLLLEFGRLPGAGLGGLLFWWHDE